MKFFALIFSVVIGLPLVAQPTTYQKVAWPNEGQNPRDLNRDAELPHGAGLDPDWQLILPPALPMGTYSAVQTLPFPFVFYGDTFEVYKVANSGYVTFDTGSEAYPKTPEIPKVGANRFDSIADYSMYFAQMHGTGPNDKVLTKTFGPVGRRQHWIHFNSYTLFGKPVYRSIVLEEQSNSIYFVAQRALEKRAMNAFIVHDTFTWDKWQTEVNVSDLPGPSNNVYVEFVPSDRPEFDLRIDSFEIQEYQDLGSIQISIKVMNRGRTTVDSVAHYYQVNGGTIWADTSKAVKFLPLQSRFFTHSIPHARFSPSEDDIVTWIESIHPGTTDDWAPDNADTERVVFSNPIPDILADYVLGPVKYETLATELDSVLNPTDLAFHPHRSKMELWVTNGLNLAKGAYTVHIYDAGEATQTTQMIRDPEAANFVDRPNAIAFDKDGHVALGSGAYDAFDDGGIPNTGVTLFDASDNYGQAFGNFGSRVDVLWASPLTLGLAHVRGSVFAAFDGHNDEVVFYDFGRTHAPGHPMTYDGQVMRAGNVSINSANNHTPNHMAYHQGYLYVVNSKGPEILRMAVPDPLAEDSTPVGFGPFQTLEAYFYGKVDTAQLSQYIKWGIKEPSGIDLVGNHLVLSDYDLGHIIFFELGPDTGIELGRLLVTPGISSVHVGPDGLVYFTNQAGNQVQRIVPSTLAIEEIPQSEVFCWPNPTNGEMHIQLPPNERSGLLGIYDVSGVMRWRGEYSSGTSLDLSELSDGVYFGHFHGQHALSFRFIIRH